MVKSKIQRKRKIIEDRKKSDDDLISKRRKIPSQAPTEEIVEDSEKISRPDELIGVIIFLTVPNILIPLFSFLVSVFFFIGLIVQNNPLYIYYFYSILMYLISASVTAVTCYFLYHQKKFSYYVAIGISLFNIATNINLLLSFNFFIILISIIVIVMNGIALYFLIFYQEIRDALSIGTSSS